MHNIGTQPARLQLSNRGIEPPQLFRSKRIARCVRHGEVGPHALKTKPGSRLPQSADHRFKLARQGAHAVHAGVNFEVDGPRGSARGGQRPDT